jgi:hypothetical protein
LVLLVLSRTVAKVLSTGLVTGMMLAVPHARR